MTTDKAYYTVAEVAALMRVHENTVRNWLRKGALDYAKVGSVIRIPCAQGAFLVEQKPQAAISTDK